MCSAIGIQRSERKEINPSATHDGKESEDNSSDTSNEASEKRELELRYLKMAAALKSTDREKLALFIKALNDALAAKESQISELRAQLNECVRQLEFNAVKEKK